MHLHHLPQPLAVTPQIDLDPEAAQRRIEETLRANAARPLFTGTGVNDTSTSLYSSDLTSSLSIRQIMKYFNMYILRQLLPRTTYFRTLDINISYPSIRKGTCMRFVVGFEFTKHYWRSTHRNMKKSLYPLQNLFLHVRQKDSSLFTNWTNYAEIHSQDMQHWTESSQLSTQLPMRRMKICLFAHLLVL